MLLQLFVLVGAIFALLAGLIAFGVTYIEWQTDRFTGWDLWREPLRRAFLTFLFFFLLAAALGYVLPSFVRQ